MIEAGKNTLREHPNFNYEAVVTLVWREMHKAWTASLTDV